MSVLSSTSGPQSEQAASEAESPLADSPASDGSNHAEFVNVPRGRVPGARIRRKSSRGELQQRINDAVELLVAGETYNDAARILSGKYGVSATTSERYVTRARDKIAESLLPSKDEHRGINLKSYRRLATAADVPPRDKIKALERIDKIVGLESPVPRQVEVSGPGGGPIQSTSAVVVCGVDLSGKLGEVGAQIRKAALATLIETIQADPKTLAAMPAGGVTVENVPETVDATPLPVES